MSIVYYIAEYCKTEIAFLYLIYREITCVATTTTLRMILIDRVICKNL